MPYLTFDEQVGRHIAFLRERGLNVDQLCVDTKDWVRCREIGQNTGRGNLAYKTSKRQLQNGMTGLITVCRGDGGTQQWLKTYGSKADELTGASYRLNNPTANADGLTATNSINREKEVADRAQKLWHYYSSEVGASDYLVRKRVGSYGVRFRDEPKYGRVCIVPLYDIYGKMWSYQILNADGTKRFAKGGRIKGLLHMIGQLVDSRAIGIAESYVTAATCHELCGITSVCAFSCENLLEVGRILRDCYPNSPVIFLADNDRHREINKGITVARRAVDAIGENAFMVEPEFGEISPAENASDWNDLMILNGADFAREQLLKKLQDLSVIDRN